MARQLTRRQIRRPAEDRYEREPVCRERSHPRDSFLARLLMVVCIIGMLLTIGYVSLNFLAPLFVAAQPPPQPPTAYPTAPPYQPASVPQAPPQIIYRDAPAALPQATAGAVIVVTPTFATGCHDGANYVNGVAVGGTCAGGLYAPEEATATVEMKAATAVPPDQTYMQTIRDMAPHRIR